LPTLSNGRQIESLYNQKNYREGDDGQKLCDDGNQSYSAQFLLAAPSFAADLEGSKDHPLLKRYEGSEIIKYEHRKYDGLTIALGKARSSSELVEARTVEGAITRLTYKVPPGRSSLEVIRNYQKELQSLGFAVPLFRRQG
jgi:hypothetical protein